MFVCFNGSLVKISSDQSSVSSAPIISHSHVLNYLSLSPRVIFLSILASGIYDGESGEGIKRLQDWSTLCVVRTLKLGICTKRSLERLRQADSYIRGRQNLWLKEKMLTR